MKGRRKPTAIKKLQGNPGNRPLNENEPKPKAVLAKAPQDLTPAAKKIWNQMSPMLYRIGVLTEADTTGLAMLCSAFALWLQAEKTLKKDGYTVSSPNGYEIPNPWFSIRNVAYQQTKDLLIQFGLTPSSRSKITAVKVEEVEDSILDIIKIA